MMNIEQTAEIKGYLYGFICSGRQSEGRTWLEPLEGGLQRFDSFDSKEKSLRATLIDLYKQVSQDFFEGKLDFAHTIFNESLSLTRRAYMLKQWCHGFLAGMQQSGLSVQQLSYIPRHFSEKIEYCEGISQLNVDETDITESDEAMFTQVVQLLEEVTLQIYRLLNHTKPKQ